MIRREFIEKVFTLFRKKAENNEELVRVYDEALSTKKPVDWDKLYKLTVMEAETSNLPMPQWFTSKFDICLKPMEYTTADGIRVKVVLKDGSYEYETYKNSLPFDEIKLRFMKKFSDSFSSMQIYDENDLQWVIY